MVWYSHLFRDFPQFVVIDTVTGISVFNEAEVDFFLEFPCFFCDPMDVGNLISGSPDFPKSSLNIWKFSVHVLLKPDETISSSIFPFYSYLQSFPASRLFPMSDLPS